jgi:ABC-2 type transport system ATP-binding protein
VLVAQPRESTAPGSAGAGVIAVEGLTKRFGSVVAVDDVSFCVDAATVVGFLGPNGAGKTTTLRMLLGLVRPTAGSATINGRPYAELADPVREVGAVLEASSFHPGRSARQHLRVLCDAAGLPLRRADETLELVGLTGAAGRRAGGYSLGMRQRLGLAAAMLGQPKVLVLDEPANGLDPEGIRWMRGLLRYLADGGATVLVSSHVLSEVAQTVDEVVIIARGRMVSHAPLADLTSSLGGVVRVRSPYADRLGAALDAERLRWRRDDESLVVDGASLEQVGDLAFRAGAPVHELVAERSNLEQVFLELTGDPAP